MTDFYWLFMKKGDIVSVLDEDIKGVIEKVKGEEVWISTDGFTLHYLMSELVVEKSFSKEIFKGQDLDMVLKEKTQAKPVKVKSRKRKKEEPIMEIDLHISQLVNSTRGLSKHDLLNIQLETAKHRLEHAIRNRIPRLVFIHGIGEGVLRMELEYVLSCYPEVNFYDADYSKYGAGATEVYIYQNPKK